MHNYSFIDCNWLALKRNNEEVARCLPLMRGVVYDLGCGTRPYEKDIRRFADAYIGIDWSNTLHELKADIVANINLPLPIADSVADTVVSFQVLEHLCEPQVLLNEAFRILRGQGHIIVTVPFQWWVHEAPYDYFRYTSYGLRHMLDKAGFVDIEVRAVTGFWSMWLLKFNYHTTRYIRGGRVTRALARLILTPLWFAGQLVAPFLDRLDMNEAETAGYVVVASKPL